MLRLSLLLCVSVALTASSLVTYHLEAFTTNRENADADASIYAKVFSVRNKLGNIRSHNLGKLDNTHLDDFTKNHMDVFTKYGEDVGDIECVELRTSSDDAWHISYLTVHSDTRPMPVTMYNTASTWLSTDGSEGRSTLKLCSQGIETYYVTTKTSTKEHAGNGRDNGIRYFIFSKSQILKSIMIKFNHRLSTQN